jgi:hypothetical protein
MPQTNTAMPDDLLQLSRQVEEWRSEHPPRSRLPEPIWTAAAEMAHRHGLHRTAKALRMDYMRLKKRVPKEAQPRIAPPAFVELLAAPTGLPECVVELESAHGKIRVAMKGMALDWAGLLHAWREAGV